MRKADRLEILQETQDALGLEDEALKYLPNIARRLTAHLKVPPVTITVVIDPIDWTVRQIANSDIPLNVEAISNVSKAMTYVAERYNTLALEVAKNVTDDSEEAGLETPDSPHPSPERGDGER